MLQLSFRRLLRFAIVAVSISMACSDAASAQLRSQAAANPLLNRNNRTHASKVRTPADRLLTPFLKSHPVSTKARVDGAVQPMAAASMPSPAFAGYLTAPMYPASTSASSLLKNSDTIVELGGDFDKDGKPDLAVLQQNGTLNILINDGVGGVKAPVSYLNPYYQTSSVDIGYAVDVNGDGYPDVVAFDIANYVTITWLNLGNGQFNAAIVTPVDTTYGYPDMVYLADVNGDGKADVIFGTMSVTSRTSATVYLETQLGLGDGTFGLPSAAKVESFNIPAAGIMPFNAGIAVGDINGDGKADIAVSIDERYSIFEGAYVVATALGNNDGTFSGFGSTFPISVAAEQTNLDEPDVAYDTSILAFADLNGDGKLDVVADINGSLVTAPGVGDGTFLTPVTSSTSTTINPTQTVLADVNGDGKLDAISAGTTMGVLLGKGDGTFAPSSNPDFVIDPTDVTSIVAGDFNNDGLIDIAETGSYYRQVSMFYSDGKGGFRAAPMLTIANDPVPENTVLIGGAKYTANGLVTPLFLYSGGANELLYTLVNDGKGNTTSTQALPDLLFEYVEPIAADFNGDGLDDLVYADISGGLWVALSKGDGTFATPVSAGLPTAACPLNYGAAGDVNGDGKLDIVVTYGGDVSCDSGAGGPSGYYVIPGKGDGTFGPATFVAAGTLLYQAKLADLNGDGKLDLILNDLPTVFGSGYQVSYSTGNGDGTFGNPTVLENDYIVADVVTADINNDGKVDLILANAQGLGADVKSAGILTYTGNGDGSFNAPSLIAGGSYFSELRTADMNNDGNVDIVATLENATPPVNYYGLVTMLGYGNGLFAPPYNALEEPAGKSPLIGDFNGDGALDVLTATNNGTASFVGLGGSSLTLTTSAASISFGQAETLTATITAGLSGRPDATGTVSFYDGPTLLGTAAFASGSAVYTTTSLAASTHAIKAVYAGDTNFNPVTSSTLTVTVAALTPAFSMSGSPSSISVTGGAQGLVTLNLAANASFSGAVNLTCSGLPSNGTCAVNPATVTLGAGGTGVASLVIGTTATHAELRGSPRPWKTPIQGASFAAVMGLLFAGRKRARRLTVLSLVLLLSASAAVIGCSGGGNSVTKSAVTVTPGNYTITVTATPASGSGAAVQTLPITLTVN